MTSYITCYNPGMETRKHIAEIVRQGLEEIQREERLTQDFHAQWTEVRRRIELVADNAAAQGARDASPDAHIQSDPENGCTRVYFSLSAKAGDSDPYLRFCPDPKNRKIVCSTGPEEYLRAEPWDPEKLTAERVGTLLGDFIGAVLKHAALKRREGPSPDSKLAKYL